MMAIKYHKKLGVLGGMGPEATANFYMNIIKRCQKEFDAKFNSDFPSIIINNYPVPDGEMWTGYDAKEVIDGLQRNAKMVEFCGADLLCLPCNSVHSFIKDIRKVLNIPVMSIIEETALAIKDKGLLKVSVFGTHFTINNKLYDNGLDFFGIKLIHPEKKDQKTIDDVIIRIVSGKRLEEDKKALLELITKLQKKESQGFIMGCTELPLLLTQQDSDVPIFDTIDVLAASAFRAITTP